MMMNSLPIKKEWLEFAYWTAGSNWVHWRDDFEFEGDFAHLPVLEITERFRVFIHQYSLLRYYDPELRQCLKNRLNTSDCFQISVNSIDGSGIDKLANQLQIEFDNFNLELSFLSKLAAFARPDLFNAWDRFARRGVSTLTDGPHNGNYISYSTYLGAVNDVLESNIGEELRKFLEGNNLPTNNSAAFTRRVLDVYLMAQGGRWVL